MTFVEILGHVQKILTEFVHPFLEALIKEKKCANYEFKHDTCKSELKSKKKHMWSIHKQHQPIVTLVMTDCLKGFLGTCRRLLGFLGAKKLENP